MLNRMDLKHEHNILALKLRKNEILQRREIRSRRQIITSKNSYSNRQVDHDPALFDVRLRQVDDIWRRAGFPFNLSLQFA